MKNIFWQTSDAQHYIKMLEVVAPHNKKYCALVGLEYEAYVGVYRGYHPWQAIFNRIVKLHTLLQEGFNGWFLYADADAYVHDVNFDIQGYLKAHSEFLFVAATGGDGRRLAVNDGIFFLNFNHQSASLLINQWNAEFYAQATDRYLRKNDRWEHDSINDQDLLHHVLGENANLLDEAIIVDDGQFINYNGSFIRQALRTSYGSFEDRLVAIKSDIERINF